MEGPSGAERVTWAGWETRSAREVAREAAAKGSVRLALCYLRHKHDWTESVAAEFFHAEVCAWVLQLLSRKQIYKALHILNKAGANPDLHLMNVARESPEIELRDYVVEQLNNNKSCFKIEESEWNQFILHWNLLRYLEKSFESDGTFKQNKVFGCGRDMVVVTETEVKGLTVHKVEKYPESWKCKIAAYLFFDSFEFSLLELLTPLSVWRHLLEHNKAMVLVRWVNMHTSELVRDQNARYHFFNTDSFLRKLLDVDTRHMPPQALEQLDHKFRAWPITQEMIQSVVHSSCFAYTKMCIYDTLCSYGIVIEDERNNLNSIVSRLARTQNLRIIDDIFMEPCATMSKRDFYVEVAKYCVENELYNALTVCVEGEVLSGELPEVEERVRGCVRLWLQFKSIEQTSDRQSHVLPVYNTCEQITYTDTHQYVSCNPHLVLGMILLDDNKQLFDIFTTEPSLQFDGFELPVSSCKEKLPHLTSVYKMCKTENFSTESDVNVYQLLSGYSGLDISKLFEFQLMTQSISLPEKSARRSLGSLLTGDVNVPISVVSLPSRSEMPHFANSKLMKRYGHVAKLNHTYYLKQNRACAASEAFMVQQYQSYNRLQERSVKTACCEAHALALQHWSEPAMTASVVSFMCMVGCTAARCRVHISAARLIKNHLLQCEGSTEEAAMQKVTSYMIKLCQNTEDVDREMLAYLERITMYNIEKQEKVNMSAIVYEWQTAVKFAMVQGLPYPETQLREFIRLGLWFPFLLFGDIFRYPQQQMLVLSQQFANGRYAEHLKLVIQHRGLEEACLSDKEAGKPLGKEAQRRLSRLTSTDAEQSVGGGGVGAPDTLAGTASASRELWEVLSVCHASEDPPGALIRAAGDRRAPLLALLAVCYEPNAVGACWAYWTLAALGEAVSRRQREALLWDVSEPCTQHDFRQLTALCVTQQRVCTLHESMLIFFPESPVTLLSGFLCRTAWQLSFDAESTLLLCKFTQRSQRRTSCVGAEGSGSPAWMRHPPSLQEMAVELVSLALAHALHSAAHQRRFLKCLLDADFPSQLVVSCPDFEMLYNVLCISMESSCVVDISRILQSDSAEYLTRCLDTFIADCEFAVASDFAKTCGLPVDNILTAEWHRKHEEMSNREEQPSENERTLLIAQCSEAFKKAGVTFTRSVEFLTAYANEITCPEQKFYSCRIILSWYDEIVEYGTERERLEHEMWSSYLDSSDDTFLGSQPATLQYVCGGQADRQLADKMSEIGTERPLDKLLDEIEAESHVEDVVCTVVVAGRERVERRRWALHRLLELKLVAEAFRLSALLPVSTTGRAAPGGAGGACCPVEVARACLRLAEGTCSPYHLPQHFRLLISTPALHSILSASQSCESGFEEVVVIPTGGGPEDSCDAGGVSQVGGREEADRACALDALAARSGLALARQAAALYRLALQLGWPYAELLRRARDAPLHCLGCVSGRARLPLAALLLRTYSVHSKQVADYLCLELVACIISPHLLKVPTFRQKEHFQYTLWGFPLDTHLEVFLNLRPEASSLIGRLLLDHLVAFRRIYKCGAACKGLAPDALDDANLDLETLIDEEYQTVEEDEVESVGGGGAGGSALTEDTCSVFSEATTVYSSGVPAARDSRRNLFDVISRSDLHVPHDVKHNVRRITKGAKLSTKQVNVICIELLVVAHECFSSACDTEGIAVVLRSAQALAAHLLAARSWRLMVRLLTGLARYTEMAYIFQMLRENHQFEFLLGQFHYTLGQRADKITEFKHGLLEYLRRYCPGDSETYCLVALHFNMHAEAAQVKRKQARDLVVTLEQVALDAASPRRPGHAAPASPASPAPDQLLMLHDNNTNRLLLETCLELCTDAAQLFLQGGSVGAARESAALAQQVALQVALLAAAPAAAPAPLVLNLKHEQLCAAVDRHLGFMEGLVLMCAAEGVDAGAQWRELAYRRVLRHDRAYIRDAAVGRPDVAADLLHRYKIEKNTTASSQAAIAELAGLCR